MRPKVIISLTSIPPRFKELGNTLASLLNQDNPADEIQVYIPRYYRRFPQHAFALPEVPERVKVVIADRDLGPATKVLFCAKAHWGTNTRIVFCDDDRHPSSNWLGPIIKASNENPDKAIVSSGWNLTNFGIYYNSMCRYPRAVKKRVIENPGYIGARVSQKVRELVYGRPFPKPRKIQYKCAGYIDVAEALGGVSIKPEFFDNTAFQIPPVLWRVDDIWLSGLLEKQDIGIWAANTIPVPVNGPTGGVESLGGLEVEGHDNTSAIRASLQYMQETYSIW